MKKYSKLKHERTLNEWNDYNGGKNEQRYDMPFAVATSIEEAIFIRRFIWYLNQYGVGGKSPDGFFIIGYKFYGPIGMSEYHFLRIVRRWEDLGILTTKLKGVPPKKFYYIVPNRYTDYLNILWSFGSSYLNILRQRPSDVQDQLELYEDIHSKVKERTFPEFESIILSIQENEEAEVESEPVPVPEEVVEDEQIEVHEKALRRFNNLKGTRKQEVSDIFVLWNSFKGTKNSEYKWKTHRKLTMDMITAITKNLTNYTADDIMNAISNYAEVVGSPDSYFTYTWTLTDFLTRKEGTTQDSPNKWLRFSEGNFDRSKYHNRNAPGSNISKRGDQKIHDNYPDITERLIALFRKHVGNPEWTPSNVAMQNRFIVHAEKAHKFFSSIWQLADSGVDKWMHYVDMCMNSTYGDEAGQLRISSSLFTGPRFWEEVLPAYMKATGGYVAGVVKPEYLKPSKRRRSHPNVSRRPKIVVDKTDLPEPEPVNKESKTKPFDEQSEQEQLESLKSMVY